MGRGNSAKRNERRSAAGAASAGRINDQRLREALERQIIKVKDSVAKIDNEIYHKEVLRAIPLSVTFGRLTDYEKQLARLHYLDKMSPKEIALHLGGSDIHKIRYDLNRLRIKIHKRVKTYLNEHKDEHNADNKLLLTWQRIHDRRNEWRLKRAV